MVAVDPGLGTLHSLFCIGVTALVKGGEEGVAPGIEFVTGGGNGAQICQALVEVAGLEANGGSMADESLVILLVEQDTDFLVDGQCFVVAIAVGEIILQIDGRLAHHLL